MNVEGIVNRIKASASARFVEKYGRDKAPLYATAIAYNAILSMFPIMIALLAIVGLFVRDPQAISAMNEAIVRVLPADVEGDALKVLQAGRSGSGLFGIIGFLGLLWGGSALFGAMADAFNNAFGVAGRGFLEQKLMAFGMIFVFAFLMLLIIVASSTAALLLGLSKNAVPFAIPGFGLLETASALLTSLLLSFLLFLILYRVVPNRPSSFKEVRPGAAIAAILFFIIVQAWPLYLAYFGNFSRFGAVFGLFFLIMTWFYFLAHIVMIGAELNAFLLPDRGGDKTSH